MQLITERLFLIPLQPDGMRALLARTTDPGASACPQRRAFTESGAANAVFLYDPTCGNGVLKSPQAFQNPKIKNILSAEHG